MFGVSRLKDRQTHSSWRKSNWSGSIEMILGPRDPVVPSQVGYDWTLKTDMRGSSTSPYLRYGTKTDPQTGR